VFIDEVDALVSGMNAQAASDILLTAMCASLFEELDAIGTHANFTQTSSNSGEDTTSLGSAARMRPLRVVVVGTTNRALELGPELRRGGRFEAELTVGAASEEQRRAMFSTVLNDTFPLRDSLSREELIKELVLRTGGYTVADIVSLASELTNTFRHTQVESTVVLVNSALAKVRPSSLRGVEARVPSINFDDVIGHGVAKERLTKMLIWPLLCREQFKKFNIPTRGGVLLYGPPGVSKTKLVAAAAASAGLPLVSCSGGDVYSPYLGEAEATIRRLFDVARRAAPCVLFVDECDAIVTNRAAGGSGANSPEARVLATFLTEFDGVEDAGQVFLVGATNRPWAIDAALLRSGRLDKLLYLAPPTKAERALLFKHFMSKQRVPLQSDIDYDLLAHLTERFTGMCIVQCKHVFTHVSNAGADIECVCTEVCMTALRRTLSASTPSSVLTEITASDLYGAVSAASPSVTPQMLQDLEIFACSTLPTHNLKR
jgi:SpoVK/Ycf46/Vps4 family AAA+-type ATPase